MDLIRWPLVAVYFTLSVIAAALLIIKLWSYYNKISKQQLVFTILFFPVPLFFLILIPICYEFFIFLMWILNEKDN